MDRISDLPLIALLKHAALFEVEQDGVSGHGTFEMLVLNLLNTPGIIAAAATATDANGNPTPDVVAFPPADYPLGTLFEATSYPAGVDGGQMTFRRIGGSGSESWEWFRGTFRASNANGDYVRSADGMQTAWHQITLTYIAGHQLGGTWLFPAAGVTAQRADGHLVGIAGTPGANKISILRSAATTAIDSDYRLERMTGQTDFVSGDTATVDVTAVGRWQ